MKPRTVTPLETETVCAEEALFWFPCHKAELQRGVETLSCFSEGGRMSWNIVRVPEDVPWCVPTKGFSTRSRTRGRGGIQGGHTPFAQHLV